MLIVLYIGSQLVSTLMATASADPNQRRMMLLLPLVFVVFLFRYPAGLLVYWITTNIWTIVQQYFIRRRMGPAPPAAGEGPAAGGTALASAETRSPLVRRRGRSRRWRGPAVAATGAAAVAPPRSPRKKKKRSGRRR